MDSLPERLKNLLIILLDAFESCGENPPLDRRRFWEKIAAAGYDESEIGHLLGWLQMLGSTSAWQQGEGLPVAENLPGRGTRFFGESEREFLTPPAFGYLLELCRAGQISPQQREILIHFASLVSLEPLDTEDIQQVLDQVLFDFPGSEPERFPADGFGRLH
jgi:uncharacterized protein Smg (DUF494 family)